MKICDFTRQEVEYYLIEGNFTKEEEEVYLMLSKGYTYEQVAELCNMGVSTIKRIKSRIWTKIERIKSL